MVTEGIVLGHKVTNAGLKVDKGKIDVIAKLPPPTNVKAVRSILGHAGFYHRFIKDFSKISRPMTKLLEKHSVFDFNEECIEAFKTLKEKLANAPIMVSLDWSQPFELMCDASDFAIGVITNKKGAENVAANHLSWLENPNLEELKEEDIDDQFHDETLMNVSSNDEDEISWFADFANYLVRKILRKGLTYAQRCKFFSKLKHYFWDELYLFKMFPDGMIRRCVYGSETRKILNECHHGPTGGHYGPSTTAKKVFDAGFYWPIIFKEAHTLLYDKQGGSFIVNEHRVKLYHYEEQLNELISEEIHHMCEEGKMKAIPFMAPFPANYRKTMPWVAEKPFIYSVVKNTCNKAKMYDLDETGEGIVKGNFLYVKKEPSEESSLRKK
ncbi:reverse transcriptase domain-containing protein [Tanacetum coccineum]